MGAVRILLVGAILLAGCAGSQGAGVQTGRAALSAGEEVRTSGPVERFVDAYAGFEIVRPGGEDWQFAPGHEAPEGILVPVVVLHPATGAQVVVQVAPDVASATEFGERLAVGLRSRPGFATTVPASSEDGTTCNFDFTLGDEVHGKVGILDATDGRLFVLLATWPSGAPQQVITDVAAIMASLRPFAGGTASLQLFPAR